MTCGVWRILTWALKNLKHLHFDGLLLTEVYIFWAKKVQRSYIWWHWILMQHLKKNDFWFEEWHEEFSKFRESCKIETLMRSFIQRRKCISSKFVLCTMLMKNDGKYEKGSDLSVQNWHEKFDKFCRKHSKISKICTLIGWFWQKYIYIYIFFFDQNFWANKSTEEWCLMALKTDANFEGKLTCAT